MFRLPFDMYPLLRPILFSLDPECAHGLAIASLKSGLFPAKAVVKHPVLRTNVMGIELDHPIGLAAGFDKQAEIIPQIFQLGFSFAEFGGVTPRPQPGNPRPRMFRIPEAKAIINRFNLNSVGFEKFRKNLQAWHKASDKAAARPVVGVNIARGDNCPDDAAAYIEGLQKLSPFVRFATLNVSCPNESCSRSLEGREQLKELLRRVKGAKDELETKPLLFIKIAPDQTEQQAKDIAEVALESGIDGMIVSNTTTARPESIPPEIAKERGGLSGKPLFGPSTALLGKIYRLTEGKIPLIASGGVFSGADAYAKIRAGASLVQIYTAMVYEGTFVVSKITNELAALLKRDGFASVGDAVGADFKRVK